jgi:hypothetical protein
MALDDTEHAIKVFIKHLNVLPVVRRQLVVRRNSALDHTQQEKMSRTPR